MNRIIRWCGSSLALVVVLGWLAHGQQVLIRPAAITCGASAGKSFSVSGTKGCRSSCKLATA
jgi:hypothetical protein